MIELNHKWHNFVNMYVLGKYRNCLILKILVRSNSYYFVPIFSMSSSNFHNDYYSMFSRIKFCCYFCHTCSKNRCGKLVKLVTVLFEFWILLGLNLDNSDTFLAIENWRKFRVKCWRESIFIVLSPYGVSWLYYLYLLYVLLWWMVFM